MTLQNSNSLRHIFLADDDQDDRQMFSDALSEVDRNIILTEAENGIELMSILQLPPNPLPDIVFLDLNMPKRGGLECLEEIRSKGDLKDLKVVMLTTSSNPDNIDTAYDLGASFYAVKPNTFNDLKKLISNVLTIDWLTQASNKRNFVIS